MEARSIRRRGASPSTRRASTRTGLGLVVKTTLELHEGKISRQLDVVERGYDNTIRR